MFTYGLGPSGGAGATDLDGLTDVTVTTAAEYQTLEYNGSEWVNAHSSVSTFVRNDDVVTMNVGDVVYLSGATGDHANVKLADNGSDTTSSKTVGLVAGASITPGGNGVVVTRGYVDGIDLSVGYTPGDVLWLGTNGAFTTTKPSAPEHLVFVGVVVRATNNGIIYVATQNGYEFDELHDVSIVTPANGELVTYNGATSLWENTRPRYMLEGLQVPVDGRRYSQLGLNSALAGFNLGSCTMVCFRDACEIDELSIYLNATYSGGTTYDYRLGAYRDNNGAPGTLIVDAGTVSISTGATAGFKTISLGSPFTVDEGEKIWLVVGANHFGAVPTLANVTGHYQPYADYGIAGATQTQAACFVYGIGPATALPATFSLASPQESNAAGVTVYAKVNIPTP